MAIAGAATLQATGQIDLAKSLYTGGRVAWLSAIVGGFLFGFGMTLASGCGSKTLVRIGGGNLKSLVVFLVMGLAAQATLRGVTAVARDATVDRLAVTLSTRQDLASVLGESFVTVYTEVKEIEHAEFMKVISPWEREHLLLHV